MYADPACPFRKTASAAWRALLALSVTPLAFREVASSVPGAVQMYMITASGPPSGVLLYVECEPWGVSQVNDAMSRLSLLPRHAALGVSAVLHPVVKWGAGTVQSAASEMKASALVAFARQLRSWRQHLGWTQVEMGAKLGYSASLISGIETMDKAPTVDFAARCDELFGTPGTFATLQELVAREAYPAFFAPVIPFEREALRIHGWELGAVPGLLQTKDYARALFCSGRPMDSAEEIDRLVAARIERQDVVNGEKPPLLWYVLDESVVRHVTGGRSVMSAQLDKLLEASDAPGIVLQVLPFTADNHAGADGPISLYEFAESPSVCYTECYGGGRIIEGRAEVANLMTVISLIRASALSARESRELIRQIRSDICD